MKFENALELMDMSKKTLGIIFGGKSSEHAVSLRSATTVINKTPRDIYDVVMIGITRDGRWFLYEGDVEKLADSSWEQDKVTPAFISPDTSVHGLVVMGESGVKTIRLDAVYPVMHGRLCEDGAMQGLLELAGIPYVGCDVASSAICMDKALTNSMLEHGGIAQAAFVWFYSDDFAANTEKWCDDVEKKLGYPCFVKPANAGSSVGVGKCHNREELIEAVNAAAEHDPKIVIEEGIDGAEVECAVLGNRSNAEASVVGQVVSANDWYDFESKYNDIGSETRIPADISEEAAAEVRRLAVKAYKLLGCSGLTRMDFFVRHSDGAVLLNEPNTLPGFTSISMYPMLWEACGVDNGQLIHRLVTLAEERMNS